MARSKHRLTLRHPSVDGFHAVVTLTPAHDDLKEMLTQAYASVARHPETLNPRL